MSKLTRANLVFPALSGLPEDDAISTLHFFSSSDPDDTDRADLALILQQFINDNHNGAGSNLAGFLGHSRSRATNAARIDLYERTSLVATSPFGSPTYVAPYNLGPVVSGTTPFPEEVACTLSYHADVTGVLEESGTTRPRARRRGRLFLGPLSNVVGDVESGTNRLKVHDSIRDHMAAAMNWLYDNQPGPPYTWVVYSPTGSATYDVVGGWVDNAFDTIRRRGLAPTARSIWP